MHDVAVFETLLILVAAALALLALARRIGTPPAAVYVLGGMALALAPGAPSLTPEPELVMVLFLPPLLLASAYFTVWRDFRANLRPILLLAIGAVAFTTLAVGLAAKALAPGLPWAACFALGAIVSPPDAVAAKAILQRGRMPERLTTILEGESLVNDATGLMFYRMAVAAALTGAFSWMEAAATFSLLAIGGVAVGFAAGHGVNFAFRRIQDPQISIVLSFLFSWAVYLAAERLHVSGVLAVVVAGLIMGQRQHAILNAGNRIEAQAVWRTAGFLLEALVFVLIGLALRPIVESFGGLGAALPAALPFALGITGVVIVSRFLWVFPATYLPRFLFAKLRAKDPYPAISAPIVVSWAGMRGVVSLAAALALPAAFPGRDLIVFTTFVVIAITVLVQGVSLGALVGWLKPESPHLTGAHLDERAARHRINAAGLAHVEAARTATGDLLHPKLTEEYRRRVRATERHATEGDAIEGERAAHFAMALSTLAATRAELLRLHAAGDIHDDTLHALEHELDLEELRYARLAGRA